MIELVRQAHARGRIPRVHGNGFLQLDLSDTVRLHIWGHPSIPRQVVPTPIHDHRFAFASLILKGSMTNCLYEMFEPSDVYKMKTTHLEHSAMVRDRQDTILVPTGREVHLAPRTAITYKPGDSYSMRIGEIHESVTSQPTITVILKYGLTLAQGGAPPSVFVPLDMKPDNMFHRYSMDPTLLWAIIYDEIASVS